MTVLFVGGISTCLTAEQTGVSTCTVTIIAVRSNNGDTVQQLDAPAPAPAPQAEAAPVHQAGPTADWAGSKPISYSPAPFDEPAKPVQHNITYSYVPPTYAYGVGYGYSGYYGGYTYGYPSWYWGGHNGRSPTYHHNSSYRQSGGNNNGSRSGPPQHNSPPQGGGQHGDKRR